ncbi:response regulator transcription factor [Sulfurimonas diazotrophicus]|uniref:Response regulator transcription factor n=1 Tax=Sulfurimonas diazotrophicus TaxID=3131939 RepID=A0ABZ3HA67_9BACT
MRILLLEDDPVLSDIVGDYLADHYETDRAYTADEATALIDAKHYDLFIFDINVPGQNGIALLRSLRELSVTTPAILVTAYEDTARLKAGFEAGAHDYIRKPFALEELRLRIENSKRLFNIEQRQKVKLGDGCVYDPDAKRIETAQGHQSLAPKEAAMLEYFLAHPGRTLSSEELVQNLWAYDQLPSDATLRSHIRRLRELIGGERITTVRGIGYRYE